MLYQQDPPCHRGILFLSSTHYAYTWGWAVAWASGPGLIYKGGRYFDPNLGIWLALMPLVVVQGWRGRKKKRGAHPWMLMVCMDLHSIRINIATTRPKPPRSVSDGGVGPVCYGFVGGVWG